MRNYLAIICISIFPCVAVATPIPLEGTGSVFDGHYYELVEVPRPPQSGLGIHWQDAERAAAARLFNGLPGHLAVITSEEENNFLFDAFMTTYDRAWIGLTWSGQQWSWITGDPVAYINWDPDVHQHDGGDWPLDPVVHPYGLMRGFDHLGGWNNLNNEASGSVYAYLVEYPIPEPATLSLLALAGALLLVRHRSAERHA